MGPLGQKNPHVPRCTRSETQPARRQDGQPPRTTSKTIYIKGATIHYSMLLTDIKDLLPTRLACRGSYSLYKECGHIMLPSDFPAYDQPVPPACGRSPQRMDLGSPVCGSQIRAFSKIVLTSRLWVPNKLSELGANDSHTP
jgi:hypothetical protein